jgi:hypothetical protein
MRIGLHTADITNFPNFALMKVSAYHKQRGDQVEWWQPLFAEYSVVYSSKIFDFTPKDPYLPPDAIIGGTGYSTTSKLPPEIDAAVPDYGLYPGCDYAIGFITRGCPNKCRWCVVPEKEGGIRPYAHWKNIVRPDTNKLVLMDNNILASEYGISQLAELSETDYRIDLNQGMDARLVTPEIADVLARIHWTRYIRFSCDTETQVNHIQRTAELLAARGVALSRLFIYMLITPDIENAARRVEQLKRIKNISLYAQAERNEAFGIRPNAAQLEFAQRYVYSGAYRNKTWDEYCSKFAGVTT